MAVARELVLEHGRNSTAYQILGPGLQYWFSDKRDAVIGFRQVSGVWVAVGDPVCSLSQMPEVASRFEQRARGDNKSVCYFHASQAFADALSYENHSAVEIGLLPGWNPADWQQIKVRDSSLRSHLNTAVSKRVTVRETTSDAPSVNLDECRRDWLKSRRLPPLQFLLDLKLEVLLDRRIFVAEQAGTAVGYLVACPVPERRGWAVEQMIRSQHAPTGTMESLIDALMSALAANRHEYLTLGLIPLASGSQQQRTSSVLRQLLIAGKTVGKRFYNFEGLEAFKLKFRPHYLEPVYAISNVVPFRVRDLYAVIRAFTGKSPVRTLLQGLYLHFQRSRASKAA